ncbi:MAG TPA: arsenosugar biosynthesis radical SAM (seleno)protein ArsS [Novimethylophilus sp.]|jgi:radical SAM/Cys-rich protein|uniref:arsenosugar biosynthesis radical SAM (seleno)protein ArsS n=1 Tax=Novimethylophilus sp. TaxID=2137426 RepID=UPI002F3FCBC6
MHATFPLLQATDFPPIHRAKLTTVQVNLGYLCNQTCVHCHVNAGPKRTELMGKETVTHVLAFLHAQPQVRTLDLTGGAPEMNPHFRYLISEASELGVKVIDRCNLTILEEPGYEDLAEFLATQQVEITASLPCYLEDNVDRQRGNGVFEASVRALHRLNALGYGRQGSGRVLNLVYNPQGPVLPPSQQNLEAAYREHLGEMDIAFDHLFTITNMPIARFGSTLVSKGKFHDYMRLLRESYRPENLDTVMCRGLLSVDWQGFAYDCDFNQMLHLPLGAGSKPRTHITELLGKDLQDEPVAIADHCYGCTAGQGSSCGGALA